MPLTENRQSRSLTRRRRPSALRFSCRLNKAAQEAQTPQELHLTAKAYASVGFQGSAMALRSKIGDAIKALDRENGAVDIVERVAQLSAALGLLDKQPGGPNGHPVTPVLDLTG
jgi:hypothetical protein